MDELTYVHMVERQTATLYELGLRYGALIPKGDPIHARKLAHAGRLIGLEFQVWDDVLDRVGVTKDTGKVQNTDLLAGKNTLIPCSPWENSIRWIVAGATPE